MSSYQVIDINGLAPEQGKSYFFDANVWIRLLLPTVGNASELDIYADFFEAVFALGTNQKTKNPPKIIITNVLASEVFNRYTRIKSKLLKKRSPDYKKYDDSEFYKKFYRPSSSWIQDLEVFQENFLAYEEIMEAISSEDCCSPLEAVNNLTQKMDYNDYLYYQICLKRGFAMVTHDGDFYVPDIEVITNHNKLLRRGN
jgi:hypothetical protein